MLSSARCFRNGLADGATLDYLLHYRRAIVHVAGAPDETWVVVHRIDASKAPQSPLSMARFASLPGIGDTQLGLQGCEIRREYIQIFEIFKYQFASMV